MPCRPALELVQEARADGYAIGYFESWNLESLQGVIDAAEQTHAPILIGFNGEFLSRPGRLAAERLDWYAALGRAAAESAAVPVGLIFNECGQDDWVRRAVQAGFSQVMPDDPDAPPDEFAQRVADLTEFAHAHGVAVEAEVGTLPCGASGIVAVAGSGVTDPEDAARFIERTGIDILAVSIGNIHVLLEGRRGLDLERLAAVRARVDVPFDLHGGTGITEDALREAIGLGVAKVCYGTYVKQRYLGAVQGALGAEASDPHKLLGYGGEEDVLVAGRHAVRDAVLERIEWLGCCGRA